LARDFRQARSVLFDPGGLPRRFSEFDVLFHRNFSVFRRARAHPQMANLPDIGVAPNILAQHCQRRFMNTCGWILIESSVPDMISFSSFTHAFMHLVNDKRPSMG
jgi:hypothetical protein